MTGFCPRLFFPYFSLFLNHFGVLFPQRRVLDSLLVAGLCRPEWDGGAVTRPCGVHH